MITVSADLRNPPSSEPAWVTNGSYCTVRASVINIPTWDAAALGSQEQAVGRFKVSGASLDLTDDPTQTNLPPAFATNPADDAVPIAAHIRKANPRGPGDNQRRIFRRGYPLITTASPASNAA